MYCPYCNKKMEHVINEYYDGWENYFECFECGCCIGEKSQEFIDPDKFYEDRIAKEIENEG